MTKEQRDQYLSLVIISAGLLLVSRKFHLPLVAIAAAVLLVAGLFSPYLLKWINRVWLLLGEAIGAVSSRLILSVVFLLVLTPMAIFYRLFIKKAALKEASSFFIERNHVYKRSDLKNAF